MLHPAVQIYIWGCLALAVQIMNGYTLTLLACVLALLSFKICAIRLSQLIQRTRWIFISVLIIYAYTGSGIALWPQLGLLSPLAKGVGDGVIQLLRLFNVLASLSLLLTFLSQSQLIAGLNAIAYPLSYLGAMRELVVVRLALTIHYAESAMFDTPRSLRLTIANQLYIKPVASDAIELEVTSLNRRDWLVIALVLVVLLGACR